MNSTIKNLIMAVAENDHKKARAYAGVIISADKTEANRQFCIKASSKLKEPIINLTKLPASVQGKIKAEDVSSTFRKDRYFLAEEENRIAREVYEMYAVSGRLAEMGINYVNALMLYGESGTGKTMFGKYIAYILELPFFYMSFAQAISSYLGSTGRNVESVFEFVRDNKCVFMIDEIDSIGMTRGKEDVGEMARIVISLMQELDCLSGETVLIGATNRIDMIDPALLRRFSMQHEVKRLQRQDRISLVTQYLESIGAKYSLENVESYCNPDKSQAEIINDIVRSVAASIRNGGDIEL